MASHPLSRTINRPVKTCTQCKQVKLKCDSKDKFPAACTRCETRNLQCVVDSSFRRTPARKRIEEMAKEIELLRNRRHEDVSHRAPESPSMLGSQDSPSHSTELSGTAILDETSLDDLQFSLDEFAIDTDTIVEIFRLFCAFFYSHLPIISPEVSIRRIYETSPLLFWTIIAITTHRPVLSSHAAVSESLQKPFLRLFKCEILDPPLPLETIQAITYMTIFPYPLRFQKKDPSWLYSGIGVNAAMYMGIHRAKETPSLRSIGVPAGSLRSRAHTWLGCFLTNTILSNHVGVPAPIKGTADLATIEYMVRTHPLPAEFAYQVMVYHTLARFFNTIVENSQENMSQSLVNIIEAELDSLKTRYPAAWSSRTEMSYLTAKLLLYTTVIIRLQTDRTTREILMRNGLSVAVRIAYLTDQGLAYESPEFPDIPSENLTNTLPKYYFRTLIIAAAFLVRFFVLNDRVSSEEQELARNHVAIAQRYLKLGCEDPLDERLRGAMLFEVLCKQEPVDLETSKLRVDDRMGASLWYDAITTGHALRDTPVHVEEPSPGASLRSKSNVSSKEIQSEPPDETDQQDISMNMNFESLDFSLPHDLWGDSIWGMFDPIAPMAYPAFISETECSQECQFTTI